MARKIHYSRTEILDSALKLLREKGKTALTARNIAHETGCSTHPIYSEYRSVKGLKKALYHRAYDFFITNITTKNSPENFLDIGVNYVQFSKLEKNIFSFLFFNKDFSMDINRLEIIDEKIINIIKKDKYVQSNAVKDYDQVFFNLWIFAHGLAALIWESSTDYNEHEIRRILKTTGKTIIQGLMNEIPVAD